MRAANHSAARAALLLLVGLLVYIAAFMASAPIPAAMPPEFDDAADPIAVAMLDSANVPTLDQWRQLARLKSGKQRGGNHEPDPSASTDNLQSPDASLPVAQPPRDDEQALEELYADQKPDQITVPQPLTAANIDKVLRKHAIRDTVMLLVVNDSNIRYLKNLLCSIAQFNESLIGAVVVQPMTAGAYKTVAIMRFFHRHFNFNAGGGGGGSGSSDRLRTLGSANVTEFALLPPLTLPTVSQVQDRLHRSTDPKFHDLTLYRVTAVQHIINASKSTNVIALDADTVMLGDVIAALKDEAVDGGGADFMYSPVADRQMEGVEEEDSAGGGKFPGPPSTGMLYIAATRNGRDFWTGVVELVRRGHSEGDAVSRLLARQQIGGGDGDDEEGDDESGIRELRLVGKLPKGFRQSKASAGRVLQKKEAGDEMKVGVRVLDPVVFASGFMYERGLKGGAREFEKMFGANVKLLHGDFGLIGASKSERFRRHSWWLLDEYQACHPVGNWVRGSGLSADEMDSVSGDDEGRGSWWKPNEIPRNVEAGFDAYEKMADVKPAEPPIIVVAR